MKRESQLWVRIYILVYSLVVIISLLFSWRILSMSAKNTLNASYTQSLNEHKMITNSLILYGSTITDNFEIDENLASQALATAASNYLRYYLDQDAKLSLTDSAGTILFNSLSDHQEQAKDLNPSMDGQRSYVLKEIEGRHLVFVSGYLEISGRNFRLDYVKDITERIDEQHKMAVGMASWLAAAMLLLAAVLYIVVSRSLKPLSVLSLQTKSIAAGNYNRKVEVRRRDEIGNLAEDFNIMTEAVKKQMQLLEKAAKDKDLFVSNLAHELKTPLTSIKGYSSLLQHFGLDSEQAKEALDKIHFESGRLDSMSQKLMDLFRLSRDNPLKCENTSIDAFFSQVKSLTQFMLSGRGQRLATKTSVEAACFDVQLFLILTKNLVENASKASDEGETLLLYASMDRSMLAFHVKDNGCGIPTEDLEHIFDPFYIQDKAKSAGSASHGLGLSLCKSIARAHGGYMTIDSTPQKGTQVTVKIPFKLLQNDDILQKDP